MGVHLLTFGVWAFVWLPSSFLSEVVPSLDYSWHGQANRLRHPGSPASFVSHFGTGTGSESRVRFPKMPALCQSARGLSGFGLPVGVASRRHGWWWPTVCRHVGGANWRL